MISPPRLPRDTGSLFNPIAYSRAELILELIELEKGMPVPAGGDDASTSAVGSGALNDGEHEFTCGASGCWNMIQDNRVKPWKMMTKLIDYPFVIESDHKLESFGGSRTTRHCFRWSTNLTGTTESALDEQGESSLGLPFPKQSLPHPRSAILQSVT